MKEHKSDLKELIELKKFEEPEEGFFDDFLHDFQQRQRRDIVSISARGLVIERLVTAFREMPWWQRSVVASAVCSILLVFLYALHEETYSYAETVTSKKHDKVIAPEAESSLINGEISGSEIPPSIVDINFAFVELNHKHHSEDVEF